jgi:hypothetical protein
MAILFKDGTKGIAWHGLRLKLVSLVRSLREYFKSLEDAHNIGRFHARQRG